MLEVIEKLLILQDRDRKILRIKDQLAHIPHERQELQSKLSSTQAQLDSARLRVKQIESDRKKLELDVDAKSSRSKSIPCNSFKPRRMKNTGHLVTKLILANRSSSGWKINNWN